MDAPLIVRKTRSKLRMQGNLVRGNRIAGSTESAVPYRLEGKKQLEFRRFTWC